MPVSCHFQDYKSAAVHESTRVSSPVTTTQTFISYHSSTCESMKKLILLLQHSAVVSYQLTKHIIVVKHHYDICWGHCHCEFEVHEAYRNMKITELFMHNWSYSQLCLAELH